MSNKKIRVRFAPSPTGWLHVGGLRTVLYNFLFSHQSIGWQKGTLILRIEDTDRQRLVPGATKNLIKVLHQMGIKYQEGPFLSGEKIIQKGKFGPYIQSMRVMTYRNLAQKLVDEGKAYYCFCSSERLIQLRKEQQTNKLPPRYDGRCRHLTKQQVKDNLAKHLPYVIRLAVPRRQEIKFHDLIHGIVSINSQDIDDQILLKSDGWPTYHLANVIDDHLMKITHVIRGEE
ncbi:MAG: glutamate--tRNA ligase, partial [Candidatus Aenigmarchaeota archaeon]|nr:glutamate--tRNA ligase [Candidatus Aenigmarchaeota archaeon]